MTVVYWVTQTESDVPANNDWLAPSEVACLSLMRFARRREAWRLGRWTAKQALAALLEIGGSHPLPTIEIRTASSGAPEAFLSGSPAPLTISISHRAGRAVCVVARTGVALGCDLEVIEPHTRSFIADYFTPQEQALVEEAPEDDWPLLSTLIWSAKESALKALGTGLRIDTRSVAVSLPKEVRSRKPEGFLLAPDFWLLYSLQDWHPLRVHHADTSRTFHGWWRHEGVQAGSGPHVLTIVASPPPEPPIMLRLPTPLAIGA